MTPICWLIGHRFVREDFTGRFFWSDFCLRCGRVPELPEFIESLREADEDLREGRTTSVAELRAELEAEEP